MERQRNRTQMKERENSTKELDQMEPSNLSDREVRVLIIKILKSKKKDIETIKRDESEVKNKGFTGEFCQAF